MSTPEDTGSVTPADEPQVANEGVDVEMEAVIVGPPGYGSPDEQTAAGRLVTLDEHPNKEEISATYGADVTVEEVSLITDAGEDVTEESKAADAAANEEAVAVNEEAAAKATRPTKAAKKTEGR